MDLAKIISELRAERAAIEEALIALEALAQNSRKRRGRPPAWLALARASGPKRAEEKTHTTGPEMKKGIVEARKKRLTGLRKAIPLSGD